MTRLFRDSMEAISKDIREGTASVRDSLAKMTADMKRLVEAKK